MQTNGWTLSEAVPPGTFTALKTTEDLLYVANLRSEGLEREVKNLQADKASLEKRLKGAEVRCDRHLDAYSDQGTRIGVLQTINRKLGSENKALAEENDRQKSVIVAQGKKIDDMCRDRDQALSAQDQTKAYVDAQVQGSCANEIAAPKVQLDAALSERDAAREEAKRALAVRYMALQSRDSALNEIAALKAAHSQEIVEITACQTMAISVLKDAHTKEVSRLRDRVTQEQELARASAHSLHGLRARITSALDH